jgi:hypothetical protein
VIFGTERVPGLTPLLGAHACAFRGIFD